MTKTCCVDFDDLCDQTMDRIPTLLELKQKYENFRVTLFTIPMRISDENIKQLEQYKDWMQLAPHGWRHTRGECLAWNADEAKAKIEAAWELGIDAPVFRAPGWLLDGDVYQACQELGYVVASHNVYRVPNTGVPEYVYNIRRGRSFKAVHGHLTDCGFNYIQHMQEAGDLILPNYVFRFPQELAYNVSMEATCAP